MTRLPLTVLLLAMLACASSAQTSRGARSGQAAPGDSMKSLVTRDFELYAPSDDDLRGASDEISVAVSQFGLHMGEQPKKMAFVLLRSAADADRFDYRGFARRGLPAVPWILPAKSAGSFPAPRPTGGIPPDPLSHEAGHRFLITYADRMLDRGRAAGLLPSDSGAAPAGRTSSAGRVAHDRHAGHPALPDWLEEAIAALCERPSSQRVRIEYLRARLDRSIPMEQFLTMSRPAEAGPGGAKTANAVGSGGASGSTTGAGKPKSAGAAAPGAGTAAAAAGGAEAERLAIFCAQALSLARFIADREDGRFVGTITEGVLRGRTVGDVLNTSQNIYSKPEVLEEQWRAWMQNVPRVP